MTSKSQEGLSVSLFHIKTNYLTMIFCDTVKLKHSLIVNTHIKFINIIGQLSEMVTEELDSVALRR